MTIEKVPALHSVQGAVDATPEEYVPVAQIRHEADESAAVVLEKVPGWQLEQTPIKVA